MQVCRPKHCIGMAELGVPWKPYWHTHFLAYVSVNPFPTMGQIVPTKLLLAPLNFGPSAIPAVLLKTYCYLQIIKCYF